MSKIFAPAPEPKSRLGYYRLLSPSAGVRVSPICLGAMNFGTAWSELLGPVDQKSSFEILDYYYEQGGNFIDTANNYQSEESEKIIGEWMKQRKNRDEIVLATKYTTPYTTYQKKGIQVNFAGNSKKSLAISVERSLEKLQTTYIDLLYVHWWDYTTSIEEVMQGLNQLVLTGKVLYLGVSDTPAWVVSKANQYARDHGLAQFVVYQGRWSLLERDLERDIIPMCKSENMGIAPWGALGGGKFKTSEQKEKEKASGEQTRAQVWGVPDATEKVTLALEKVGKRLGYPITSVALAYVMHKAPYVFPIVGGRKTEHLKGNIEALSLKLTPEDIKELEASHDFSLGFPHDFLGGTESNNNFLLNHAAHYEWVKPATFV